MIADLISCVFFLLIRNYFIIVNASFSGSSAVDVPFIWRRQLLFVNEPVNPALMIRFTASYFVFIGLVTFSPFLHFHFRLVLFPFDFVSISFPVRLSFVLLLQ